MNRLVRLQPQRCINFSHKMILYGYCYKTCIRIVIVGYRNLNNVIPPCVIHIAEGAIIMPRRSHSQTVRPCQWHVTKEGHTVEKKFQRRG